MRAFCKQYDAPIEAIVTECGVFEPVALNAGKERPKGKRVSNAMWDTGSTDTLISSAIVKELNLQPIDIAEQQFANGETTSTPALQQSKNRPLGRFFFAYIKKICIYEKKVVLLYPILVY